MARWPDESAPTGAPWRARPDVGAVSSALRTRPNDIIESAAADRAALAARPIDAARPHKSASARRSPSFSLVTVLAATAVAAAAYALLELRVHRGLHTTAFDLAFFDQILWNTAHGRLFQTTYVPHNFLGQHFELLLLPLAGLYRLGAGPETLVVLQAAGAALAAVPLYFASRRLAGSLPALGLALAYLVAPALQRGLDFGFHPDLFEPLFAFAALAALLAGRRRWFVVCLILLGLLKEDGFLVAAALGWVALLRGERRLGGWAIGLSLLWGALAIGVFMPLLRGGHGSDLAARYGYLGGDPPAIALGTLLHPGRVFAHLWTSTAGRALLGIFAPLAFLPLLAPEVLVAALPATLVGLLSLHPQQRALDLQYAAPVLAIATVAAVFGLLRAVRFVSAIDGSTGWRLAVPSLALVTLAAGVGGAVLRGPLPFERGYAAWRFRVDGDAAALTRVASKIPPSASLSAQTGLAPHLSRRRVQWEFPTTNGADFVILQDGGIVSQQSRDRYALVRAALPALGYLEVAHDGQIRLFHRAAAEVKP